MDSLAVKYTDPFRVFLESSIFSVISLHFVRQALEAELLTLKGRAEEMEQQLADAQQDRSGTRARVFLIVSLCLRLRSVYICATCICMHFFPLLTYSICGKGGTIGKDTEKQSKPWRFLNHTLNMMVLIVHLSAWAWDHWEQGWAGKPHAFRLANSWLGFDQICELCTACSRGSRGCPDSLSESLCHT